MTRFKMRILSAIPNGREGQEFFYSLTLLLCILTLSGCVTSKQTAPLAPIPPVVSHEFIEYSDFPIYAAHYFNAHEVYSSLDVTNDVLVPTHLTTDVQGHDEPKLAVRKGCSIKDRFDRDALVAFEWDRSRMSFDVDGVGSSDAGMKLEYKIRLQPEKNDKQKCRYNAQWQGLLGSSYNELMLRKEDTVWLELREKQKETMHYLEQLF